ncbi:hypothetical protein CN203_11435 [Sinorhizobium meliloti]|uniref:hypothetical protein n=1 Tax=Rhizobium meliloti TaxID=382 RepID=UPI0003793B3C|nr:hypothetical protein [Sinorhizobium meliloti]RVH78101.1 hypothetical protein CN203_11435 [Sinorhizobium meliloti]
MTHALRRRRPLGIRPRVSIESMDRQSLLCEAILRDEDIERALNIDWVADDETCRLVGWWLVKHTGTLFHIGRRLLELSTPGGALLPAFWRLGGTGYHRDYDCKWVWTRLLYLHRDKSMAQTTDGWMRLGKRMSA